MPPCVFDLNHKSRLVMHCYITDCLARGMTVSAVQRGADDKGFSRCANIECLAN